LTKTVSQVITNQDKGVIRNIKTPICWSRVNSETQSNAPSYRALIIRNRGLESRIHDKITELVLFIFP